MVTDNKLRKGVLVERSSTVDWSFATGRGECWKQVNEVPISLLKVAASVLVCQMDSSE